MAPNRSIIRPAYNIRFSNVISSQLIIPPYPKYGN